MVQIAGSYRKLFSEWKPYLANIRLIHLLFTEIILYYGAQKFLYSGLTTEISVPHSTENFCEK